MAAYSQTTIVRTGLGPRRAVDLLAAQIHRIDAPRVLDVVQRIGVEDQKVGALASLEGSHIRRQRRALDTEVYTPINNSNKLTPETPRAEPGDRLIQRRTSPLSALEEDE